MREHLAGIQNGAGCMTVEPKGVVSDAVVARKESNSLIHLLGRAEGNLLAGGESARSRLSIAFSLAAALGSIDSSDSLSGLRPVRAWR
jgi:hypothetical protein